MDKILKDITIYDPKVKSKNAIKQIWEGNQIPLILIHWLRRFG